jgi:CheY-like chemotaxis protein
MSTRILVIDDDPEILALYEDLLDLAGYTCLSRTTPIMAIDDVAHLAPSLIILDWFQGALATATSVPTIELMTALRQSPTTTHIPRIVCSGVVPLLRHYDDWFAEQGVALVEKPFDIDVLLERIAALIGRS